MEGDPLTHTHTTTTKNNNNNTPACKKKTLELDYGSRDRKLSYISEQNLYDYYLAEAF